MKKHFIMTIVACLIATTFLTAKPVTAKSKQTIILETIQRSETDNALTGIKDPNKILPGDYLIFTFEDGHQADWRVAEGETQWGIVDSVITANAGHGNITGAFDTDSSENQQRAQVTPLPVHTPESTVWQSAEMPWWGWVIVALLIALAGFAIYSLIAPAFKRWRVNRQERRRPRTDNPVTAGPAFDSNGVNQTNLEQSAQAAAQRQHPGARIVPGTIQAGFLSGTGRVHFSDGRNELFSLNRQRGYQAQAQLPNGELRMIQFLQGCANDVTYGGRYYAGLTFEVETVTTTESAANSATPAVTNTTVSALSQIPAILQAMQNGGIIFVGNDGTILVNANEKSEFNLHMFTHKMNGKQVETPTSATPAEQPVS